MGEGDGNATLLLLVTPDVSVAEIRRDVKMSADLREGGWEEDGGGAAGCTD